MREASDNAGENSLQSKSLSTEISLKPILLLLKICGMYFHPIYGNNRVEDFQYKSEGRTHRISRIGSRVYCYCVLLILWFNSVRTVVSFFPLEKGSSLLAIPTVWYLQCAINATIMVISCHKRQGLQLFYKHWDSVFKDSSTKKIHIMYKCSSKSMRLFSLIGWLLFLTTNVVVDFMILQSNYPLFLSIRSFLVRPFENVLWSRVMTAILCFHQTGAWLFPLILFLAVSRMTSSQFSYFKESLSGHIKEAKGSIPNLLPELRSHYLRLSTAVEILNETFKWMLGFAMVFAIFMACFTSYQLISSPEDTATLVVLLVWLIFCLLYLCVLTLSASHVHTSAQSTLGVLITTGTRDATPEFLGQLNLFLTKLNSAPVGFTVVDFFLITKEFLLTVIGLYLTYFLIILQMKID